jgi:hypothetical protein
LLGNLDVVGAHWFQYYDEPKNGRGDGENYNFGLVDTSNRPYTELLDRGKSLDLNTLHAQATLMRMTPRTTPPETTNPADLTTWDRAQGYATADQPIARGDLYTVWSPQSLSVGMIWPEERFAEQYFRAGKIPPSARTTVEIEVPAAKARCVVRLSDTGAAVVDGPKWVVKATPGTTTRFTISIPSVAFGSSPLKAGVSVSVNVKLSSECKAYVTTWKVRKTLAGW